MMVKTETVLQSALLLCVCGALAQEFMSPNVNIMEELGKLKNMEERLRTMEERLQTMEEKMQNQNTLVEQLKKENGALKTTVETMRAKLESLQSIKAGSSDVPSGPVISHVDECGDYPTIKNGNLYVDQYALTFWCYPPYKLRGPEQVMCFSGQWSEVPICEVESDVHSGPVPSHVRNCGDLPTIEHGDVTEDQDRRVLTVQCAAFYKLEGLEEVRCVNRKWSDLPVCKAPCRLDQSKFYYPEKEYMLHGEEEGFYCSFRHKIHVKCENGRAYYRGCGDYDW
ncbi:complement factor H-related protein 5-like isoform X5 [Colossoma macropomum]|uniref:complement factor H-related protein 5-like isoform X5 n=1 Tax=Colossoma macropomum TaxID=42526 RepID=UPI00186413F8|nr:complement factor H-related protein 5-like isoform X5 [Colossoma macropomum]